MKKYYTIPFFVPLQGCPHKCVFCDQNKITGKDKIIPEDIAGTINKYLTTIDTNTKDAHIEAGFFGGTFTGLPESVQEQLLKPIQPFLKTGRIHGIRLSTRPDFISEKILDFLKRQNVTSIELGVQSMSDEVLVASQRGHTAKDTIKASKIILEKGFVLGHQIMIGLPLSTYGDEKYTAEQSKELGAKEVRLYPVVVIKNTGLARLWERKEYIPLDMDIAVSRCAELIMRLEAHNIKVIRCGLHPSEGLLNGQDLLAGPFHPAFGLKVQSNIFAVMLGSIPNLGDILSISYNKDDESAVFGFKKENMPLIKKLFGSAKVDLKSDCSIPRGALTFKCKNRTFVLDRKRYFE